MTVRSAGLLLFRHDNQNRADATAGAPADAHVEVFIAHMGGPFWARKHEGAWSIPKGELDGDENELVAARREFAEEIGVPAPDGEVLDLGDVRYSSGKLVRVFAIEASVFEVAEVRSNLFTLEWPPRSGQTAAFPEIDDARWVGLDDARELLAKGQRPVLDALERVIRSS